MTAKFATLNVDAHKKIRLKNFGDYAHIKDQHVAPVELHEFVKTATSLPIVFIKPGDEQVFHPVAMMGLKPGENLVVKGGTWNGVYIPASVMIHPFSVSRTPNQDEYVLTIDENSPLISETEGQALFEEDGKGTEFLEHCKTTVTGHFDRIRVSRQLIDLLAKKDLIRENNLSVNYGSQPETINLQGIYIIDEEKLNALPAEDFEELRKLGLLPVIYAQLASLHQLHRLHNMSMA